MPKRRAQAKEEEGEPHEQADTESQDEEDSKPAANEASGDDDSKSSKKSSKTQQWTAEDDDNLLMAVLEDQQDREAEGNGDDEEDWDEIAKFVPTKTPVQCLKRYLALNKKGQFGGFAFQKGFSFAVCDHNDQKQLIKSPSYY